MGVTFNTDEDVLRAAANILANYRTGLCAVAVLVAFGSCAADDANDLDHYRVEVMAGGSVHSARAKYLPDAVALARAKAAGHLEALAKKRRKGVAA